MSEDFDPYYKWLAIPPEEQPPHHYRLLGIPLFTADADVIENAADQRMTHLRSVLAGNRAVLAQKLLNDLATARLCLLNCGRRLEYDAGLRQTLRMNGSLASVPAAQPQRVPILPTPAIVPQPSPPRIDAVPVVSTSAGRRKRNKASTAIFVLSQIIAPIAGLACGYLVLCAFSSRYDFLGLFRDRAAALPTQLVNEVPPTTGLDHGTSPGKSRGQEPQLPENSPNPSDSKRLSPTQPQKIAPGGPLAEDRKASPKEPDPTPPAQLPASPIPTLDDDTIERKISSLAERQSSAVTPSEQGKIAYEMLNLFMSASPDRRRELIPKYQNALLLASRKSADASLERNATRLVLGQDMPNDKQIPTNSDAGDPATAIATRPSVYSILERKTALSKGATIYVSNCEDRKMIVGMAKGRAGRGAASAGMVIQGTDVLMVKIQHESKHKPTGENSFVGLMVDFSTPQGYTRRLAFHFSINAKGRKDPLPSWGANKLPDFATDVGQADKLTVDLRKEAPADWDGKIYFSAHCQDGGWGGKFVTELVEP